MPGGIGHDDPPFGSRVAGGASRQAAGLLAGDGPDPAQVPGPGTGPSQHLPGQRHVQQPGNGPPFGGPGERGRYYRWQPRPVRLWPAVLLVVDVAADRGVVRTREVVIAGSVCIPRWWHVIARQAFARCVFAQATAARATAARRVIARRVVVRAVIALAAVGCAAVRRGVFSAAAASRATVAVILRAVIVRAVAAVVIRAAAG